MKATSKRSEPPYRRHPLIALRVKKEMITAIDRWGAAKGLSRSGAIRQMIERALKQGEKIDS
jgi:hypothetical protein